MLTSSEPKSIPWSSNTFFTSFLSTSSNGISVSLTAPIPFVKYADETEVNFTNIVKNDNGEDVLYVHFERPTEDGFDSVRFELPSYKIVYTEGHYSEEEIELFRKVVEKGAPYFYRWAEQGGVQIA